MTRPPKVNFPWMVTAPRGEHGGRTYYDKRYNTQRWKRIRRIQIINNPWCVECLRKIPAIHTPATVVDHIRQVKNDGDFWDSSNHQSMCAKCHNIKSGKEAHQ